MLRQKKNHQTVFQSMAELTTKLQTLQTVQNKKIAV
jgi:hypothetical protein